jgi:topoisomerase-4 subunit A
MTGRNKAGKQFFTIDAEEQILPPLLFTPADDSWVVSVTRLGRLLAFPLAEMKRLAGGGKGLIVMGLEEGDALAAILVECKSKLLVTTRTDAGREQQIRVSENDLQSHFGKRARMGRMLALKAKSYVTALALVS